MGTEPTGERTEHAGTPPAPAAAEKLEVAFRLGDWPTEPCEHKDAAGTLPKLWAEITVEGHAGWAGMALHRTNGGWATCEPIMWALEGSPPDEQLDAWAQHAVLVANATPFEDWRTAYRTDLQDRLKRAHSRLEWDLVQLRHDRTQIRQLECAAAAAELTDPVLSSIAHRLLATWTGSAEDLVALARAVGASADP